MALNIDLDSLLSNIYDAVLLLDTDLLIELINPAAERILGVSNAQACGKLWSSYFPEVKDLAHHTSHLVNEHLSFTLREVEFVNRQRQNYFLEIHAAPIFEGNHQSRGIVIIMRDVTSAKIFEEERRAYDRLTSISTIAAGLAHEIKNPLSGIKAAAQMLARELPSDELKEYPQMIVGEVDRLNKLITELLQFSKPKKIVHGEVNINKVLDELLHLMHPELNAQRIKLELDLDPSLPAVYGNEQELRQALLNFIKNALEAMPDGAGNLLLRTKMVTDYIYKDQSKKMQRMVEVKIQDTGVGISEEHKAQLFAPFFTTKSKGTGLGLMIAQKMIHDSEGMLRISSDLGKGTRVRVYLKVI